MHASMLLKKALSHLQPRQQRTIELTYYEGLTADEIAARTGETVRVVRHNLYRGLERLRLQLRPATDATGKGDPR
jgi:RNA polymerase sigma-70 factor (ECF subfamily)